MVSPRFNIIEHLNLASKEPSKELRKKTPFDPRDVPDIFRRMYDVANALASREGLVWMQAKLPEDAINRVKKHESPGTDSGDDEPLPMTQLLDFVKSRREEYLQRMTQLLELYEESRPNRKEEDKDK